MDVRRLAWAAGILMAATIASRALGLVRDVVIAAHFGTSPELAAYVAAFKIPDLLFFLAAGGAFGSAFIPVFQSYLARERAGDAWLIANAALTLVAAVSLGAAIVLYAAAPWLVPLLVVPGFTPEYRDLAVQLTRIVLISPVFFGLSGIATGVLQGRQRFLLPALAPIFYNLSIIGGAVLLGPLFGVYGLTLGVVAGAALHFAVQVPGLIAEGLRYRPVVALSHPGIRSVGRLLLPRILGLSAAQLTFVAYTNLASTVSPASVAALNYAWLLTMLPLGLFGIAISTAVFPTLAEQAAYEQVQAIRETLSRSLRLILFLTIPASAGLMVLGGPIIALLFERAAFTAHSTQLTAWALLFFAAGLFAHATVEIVTRAFYALRDTRTPVLVAVGSMLLNVGLSVILVRFLAHGGLALSMSLATAIEAFCLVALVERRLGGLGGRDFGQSILKTCLATATMAAVLLAFTTLAGVDPTEMVGRLLLTGSALALGGLVYFGAAWLLRSDELRLLAAISRQ